MCITIYGRDLLIILGAEIGTYGEHFLSTETSMGLIRSEHVGQRLGINEPVAPFIQLLDCR